MKGNAEMVQYLISRDVNLQAVDNVSTHTTHVSGYAIMSTTQSGRCCLHLDEVIKNLSLLKLLVGCYKDKNITVERHAKVRLDDCL